MTRQPSEHDPEIAAAIFCENVLVERDGTHSFIRIVDSVSMSADEDVDLNTDHTLTHPLSLAIVLRSKTFAGTKHITIRHTPPGKGTALEGLPKGAEIEVSPGRLTVASVQLTGGQVSGGIHVFEIRIGGGQVVKATLEVHFGKKQPVEATDMPMPN